MCLKGVCYLAVKDTAFTFTTLELLQEPGTKPKYYYKTHSFYLYHLGNYKDFKSSGQESGKKSRIHITYYITILYPMR